MLSENSREIIKTMSIALDALSAEPFKARYITGLGKIYMRNT
ncbi:hypothetical protein PAU_01564 [Photorhabdus asymbiotica]|uniref:Uncharacterized protein n=2 Tax=Photorhabdus asymbiotica TaxID=291112 RepID=C7BRT6_PHOAA|nr:hypothetical protein BDD30_0719 [Photorhabdus asymbiotica]CAQ83656.1 hypothetical protein PAU_01564 [Photorhabdus asymbiotica]